MRPAATPVARGLLAAAVGVLWLTAWPSGAAAAEEVRLTMVSHLHSDFSSGWVPSMEAAARRAEAEGVDVLICTDHLLRRVEYGLWPARRWLRQEVRLNAVFERGVEAYLAQIALANQRHPRVLLLPGFEVVPFYYWSGSPLGGLTLHAWHQHLLIAGLTDPAVIRALPVTSNPFRPSPFDPYHGDQGARPYQAFIEACREAGGLVFWAHPWGGVDDQVLRGVRVAAGPYFERLADTDHYTGFEYGDLEVYGSKTLGRAEVWDQLLMDYCRGRRSSPVWVIADTSMPNALADKRTVLWAAARTPEAVLAALRAGRMYAVVRPPMPMVLETCRVRDLAGGAEGTLGETVRGRGPMAVRVRVGPVDPRRPAAFMLSVIRDGAVIARIGGQTPWEGQVVEDPGTPGARTYYRVEIEDAAGARIVANPIFAHFTDQE